MDFDYRNFFTRLYEKINDDDILGNAAQVAFYFSFALFPLLLFLMTLLGLVLGSKLELQQELFTLLAQVMPGSAFQLVQDTMEEVTASASGGKLTFGIIITLWSASAGVDNMRGTLNEVYNLKETRSWLRAKLTSLTLTVAVGLVILTALGLAVYGSQILDQLLPIDAPIMLEALEWIATIALVLLAFALLYNFAPNHDAFQWKWISPGALAGVILWVLVSAAFRLYLSYFDSYAATYGSLGAVIILLLWLYLTALSILIGGAINAIFDEKSGIKKEAEDPQQVKQEEEGSSKEAKT
ncbi:MAG: YihY/virulence factor BrkB family protein [bacterium]|nr:YihY/virulence factor BrkB family protein [bacterium]